MKRTIKSDICLLGAAIIWGFAFVAQRDSMDTIGPFLYSAIRMLLGSLALAPIFLITDSIKNKNRENTETAAEKNNSRRTLIKGGIVAGIVVFFAANMQQVGLISTDAGKTAFITALYILLVPIIGIFMKHKTNINNWIGAVIGATGLYFLCVTAQFTVAAGDMIVFIGAFGWAAHILIIDYFAPKVNVAKLICLQFAVAGLISLIVAFIVEDNTFAAAVACAPSLLYTGIVSCGIGFTLQAAGQKNANPTTASILLSMESVFGALAGFIFLNETMTGRELTGCVLMLAAVIIAQLPVKKLAPASSKI